VTREAGGGGAAAGKAIVNDPRGYREREFDGRTGRRAGRQLARDIGKERGAGRKGALSALAGREGGGGGGSWVNHRVTRL